MWSSTSCECSISQLRQRVPSMSLDHSKGRVEHHVQPVILKLHIISELLGDSLRISFPNHSIWNFTNVRHSQFRDAMTPHVSGRVAKSSLDLRCHISTITLSLACLLGELNYSNSRTRTARYQPWILDHRPDPPFSFPPLRPPYVAAYGNRTKFPIVGIDPWRIPYQYATSEG